VKRARGRNIEGNYVIFIIIERFRRESAKIAAERGKKSFQLSRWKKYNFYDLRCAKRATEGIYEIYNNFIKFNNFRNFIAKMNCTR
jgi:hypothetical protein